MIGNVGLHLQEKLSVSGCVSDLRLDPYSLNPYPSKHRQVTWKYPACDNSLGEESTSISAAAFPTVEFVGKKCATNFTPWFCIFHQHKLQIVQELTAAHKALRVRCCQQMVHTHADLHFTGPYCSRQFLWEYLNSQVFTHPLSDINNLKNAIRQEIANVTQDIPRRVMASVLGRWQQCLDCHAGHFQDVVLKTWGVFFNPRHWLT